jgi:hypothetical protein
MHVYLTTRIRGCLKRGVLGIACRQETAKTLNFEGTSLKPGYNLRRSLTFQATSQGVRRNGAFPLVTSSTALAHLLGQ